MSSLQGRFRLIAMDASARLAAFARDVQEGLTSRPKRLSCCYFYDQEGSNLFEEICELPEYYLPAAEREILLPHAATIASGLPQEITLVELGSGNASKTRILIEAILRRQKTLCYVPIDICRTVLEESSVQLLKEYPALEIVAVAGEYHEGLRHLREEMNRPKLILWLGSNVGNFDREEATLFLRRVRTTMRPDDRLLIGVDLRKECVILEGAYDDSRGVTAQFNLNILSRINRELGGHFDLEKFRHRAVYNNEIGRIEMYLDSLEDQQVAIDQLKMKIPLAAGEAIHTENSYKYSSPEIDALASGGEMRVRNQWLDSAGRFAVNMFVPNP
jgi:dimethylhistidine N-methyltransferase